MNGYVMFEWIWTVGGIAWIAGLVLGYVLGRRSRGRAGEWSGSVNYGVRHPNGRVSVTITGHPFYSWTAAEAEARKSDTEDGGCGFCGEDAGQRKHEVVARQVGPWCGPAVASA